MSSIVQNMLQKALGDGARSTKFEVLFALNDVGLDVKSEDLMILCKTTAFPSKSHTIIDFKYKGRNIPIKGQVKYGQTWECTFYLSEDHKLKNAFEVWVESLDQKHNYRSVSLIPGVLDAQAWHSQINNYTTTVVLYQRNFDDTANTAKYTLYNVFPVEVSPIQYSYESIGQIQEFTVAFAYSHFSLEVMVGKEGNFVDTLVSKFKEASQKLVDGTISRISSAITSLVSGGGGKGNETLKQLNDWAKGLKTDILPPASEKTARELVSGGLPSSAMVTSLQADAKNSAPGATGGSLDNAITQFNTDLKAAKDSSGTTFNNVVKSGGDALDAGWNKVKSAFK